jgi:activator of HSP90 ATPase
MRIVRRVDPGHPVFGFFSCKDRDFLYIQAVSESITIKFVVHAPAKAIYDAWLNGAEHSQMTGAKATASRLVGGAFTAWDGYISGKNLLLLENKKIVQSWRSSEFPEEAADSVLSVQLIEGNGITEVDLEHKDIPPGQGVQYQSGWIEFYANPMQKYFSIKFGSVEKSPKKPAVKRKVIAQKTAKKKKPKPKGKATKRKKAK